MLKRYSYYTAALAIICLVTVSMLLGCNTITIPTPDEIIKKPLGSESVKIGMSKQQVESLWGKPDHISTAENKEKWSSPREVWIYNARYGAIPVDAGYLSKTQKLYFDGENLTEIVG